MGAPIQSTNYLDPFSCLCVHKILLGLSYFSTGCREYDFVLLRPVPIPRLPQETALCLLKMGIGTGRNKTKSYLRQPVPVLDARSLQELTIAWRKSIKIKCKLDCRTHSRYFSYLDFVYFECQFESLLRVAHVTTSSWQDYLHMSIKIYKIF